MKSRSGRNLHKHRWFALYFMGSALLAGIAGYGVWRWAGLREPVLLALISWLVAVNLATLHAYWLDKRRAVCGAVPRLPERVLLGLALAGGSPAALLGIHFFRHKSRKRSFQLKLALVLLVQTALALAFFRWPFDGGT